MCLVGSENDWDDGGSGCCRLAVLFIQMHLDVLLLLSSKLGWSLPEASTTNPRSRYLYRLADRIRHTVFVEPTSCIVPILDPPPRLSTLS